MTKARKNKSILVVEDEKFLRDLYKQIIEEEGYDVETASEGEAALFMIKNNTYDLILLDIILPKIDGISILENISKTEKRKFDNVVLLTNLGQNQVIAKALNFGVRGYMIKSDYTPERLLKEIENYMND